MINKKKALIFGANGQDGFYLKQTLEKKGVEVITVSRNKSDYIGDIKSYDFVNHIIMDNKPDYIFNLAANSSARHDVLFDNHEVIGTGTVNILESVYKNSPDSKVFITGSGLQFKNNQEPINEDTEFEALSPYSASRIYSVYMARYYRSLGLKTYVGYLFNHESPLRKPDYISQKIIHAVNSIKKGSMKTLEIGDLKVEKEWTYAGDIVEAIITLIEQDNIFETVIGSGLSYSIRDWIEICFSLGDLKWQDYIVESKNFSSNYKKLVSNPLVIKNMGWSPKVNINQLAELMMNAYSNI